MTYGASSRQGEKAFEMELSTPFGGLTDKYEVSSDGKTIVLHRVRSNKVSAGGYMEKSGTMRRLPEYVAVFDRVD